MRKLGLVLSVAVLAGGTAAHAQTSGGISNIGFSAGSTVNSNGVTLSYNQPDTTAGTSPGGPPGASFNSFVDIGRTAITFESSNITSSAPFVNTNSFSNVSFTVTNNIVDPAKPATFTSTITAAGLGFYLADTSNCLYSGCAQAVGSTFGQLGSTGATVGFNFSITSQALNDDGTLQDTGPVTLKTLSGSLGINRDGSQASLFLDRELGTAGNAEARPSGARSLMNFGETRGDDFDGTSGDIGLASAIGYAWDATDISFDLLSTQFQRLTYRTSVFSTTDNTCIGTTSICLVAYSGFGDPVGRDGSVTDFSGLFGPISSFTQPLFGTIGGVNFSPTTFAIPTFDGISGSFETAPVPEPATWTMMIAGFGLLGAALRRRRVLAYN
jgi:hypothetical protein